VSRWCGGGHVFCNRLITENGECTTAFRTRGQAIGASLQKIWKSHSIPISTMIRLMNALVWPVVTYGSESWTLRKNEDALLEAFEMKRLRKSMRVLWTAKKTRSILKPDQHRKYITQQELSGTDML